MTASQQPNVVAQGYDAVYAALPHSPAFRAIWREHVLGPDFPEDFEHISFLTLAELARITRWLRIGPTNVLADLACGASGPGLYVARETGAHLVGVDISPVAVDAAAAGAARLAMSSQARFLTGTFANTGLGEASVDAAMSADALQYAPDKPAAFRECARILKPGGRMAFVAFELDPDHVGGLPILGDDPTSDYSEALQRAGFTIDSYEETPGWLDRLTRAYQAIADARTLLTEEMGAAAANALLGETTLTLERQPYRRRVLVTAARDATGAR